MIDSYYESFKVQVESIIMKEKSFSELVASAEVHIRLVTTCLAS